MAKRRKRRAKSPRLEYLLQKGKEMKEQGISLGDYSARETIQLTDLAVRHRLPPYANEDDMYEALERCGMRVDELFAQVDMQLHPESDDQAVAATMINMLFEAFDSSLLDVTAHKVPT